MGEVPLVPLHVQSVGTCPAPHRVILNISRLIFDINCMHAPHTEALFSSHRLY